MEHTPEVLAGVDWAAEGTGPFVEALSNYYLHTAGNATPRKVRPLIAYLLKVGAETRVRAGLMGGEIGFAAAQFNEDWTAYTGRLIEYRNTVDELYATKPDSPSPRLAEEVVNPLVSGWFPDSDIRQVPDAANTVIQARQVGVAQKAMSDAWGQLVDELTPGAPTATIGKAWAFGIVAGLLGALYLSRD